MTPAPYPKPSHGSVICTFADCPDILVDACKQESHVGEKGIYRPIWCDDLLSLGFCPRGFAR
jgi:hypothetical protein